VLIAILAYNEIRHLPALIAETRAAAPGRDLVVIDDGSTDGTRELLQRQQIPAIHHAVNRGKGVSLRTALAAAVNGGYTWLITLDGDRQHDPLFIPDFIAAIESEQADFIIGCRQGRGGKMPLLRQLSNGISSILVSLFSGVRFHDAQCGFRAMRVGLAGLKSCRENGFQYESEVLMRLSRKHCKFLELPISTHYPSSTSRIRYLTDSGRFIRLLWRSLWW
jgi:glycosyltransferase involved in cell wall biosynthesis